MVNLLASLPSRTKVMIVALSIFLISLTVGLLMLGNDALAPDSLSSNVLRHSSGAVMITP